jgi:hypothetical protein
MSSMTGTGRAAPMLTALIILIILIIILVLLLLLIWWNSRRRGPNPGTPLTGGRHAQGR